MRRHDLLDSSAGDIEDDTPSEAQSLLRYALLKGREDLIKKLKDDDLSSAE